jgi:hypothetical protein
VTIQGAAFIGLMVIAVIFAVNGSWALAGVFVLLALFPGAMLLALIHKVRSVRQRADSRESP